MMRVIFTRHFPPKGYKAITLLNVIFVRRGCVMRDKDFCHEAIHWEQEKELLVIGFYVLYVIEFLVRLCLMRRWKAAYHAVSFEREAYAGQGDWGYLDKRAHYSWIKYIRQ